MQQELLYQLHDIQLPEAVGWWPLAFSWWILIFSVTSILIGILWYYFDLKKRNAYRVEALKKMQQILTLDYDTPINKIAALNALLKQVAITAYGRKQAAALQSEQWVQFLAENCNYIKQPASLQQHLEMGYKNQAKIMGEEQQQALATVADYTQKWIKGHHQ